MPIPYKNKSCSVLLGYCAVDSGMLLLCDPCYIDSYWQHDEQLKSTELFNDKYRGQFSYAGAANSETKENGGQLKFQNKDISGCGVAVSTGYGDGYYPVVARLDKDNRVKSISVKFI